VLRFVYNNNCQLGSDTMGMTMLVTFTNDMLYIPISTALASFETNGLFSNYISTQMAESRDFA